MLLNQEFIVDILRETGNQARGNAEYIFYFLMGKLSQVLIGFAVIAFPHSGISVEILIISFFISFVCIPILLKLYQFLSFAEMIRAAINIAKKHT